MSFSADWLALRAPADDRARAADLIAAAARSIEAPAEICDLGAGTGATLRALSPRLPRPQNWRLVDADAGLLAEAARRAAAEPMPGVAVATQCADLVADPAPWRARPSLVTASALFDLTSAVWIERFAKACGAAGVPVLAMLSFDGLLEAAPVHPFDAPMRQAFNTHQCGDKGFGPAAGPHAPEVLGAAFSAEGFRVESRGTPWDLRAGRDDRLIAALLTGWADAAGEIVPADKDAIADWLQSRLSRTERLVVGHKDQLFIPQR